MARLYSLVQAAEVLNVDPAELRDWAQDHDIDCVDGTFVFQEADLEAVAEDFGCALDDDEDADLVLDDEEDDGGDADDYDEEEDDSGDGDDYEDEDDHEDEEDE